MSRLNIARWLFFALISHASADYADTDPLFNGVTRQAHSYSCGTAALTTLINGTVQGSHLSEQEVVHAIRPLSETDTEDYSIGELDDAAKKLGYISDVKSIPPTVLPNLKQPVILLLGLNSSFQHFVVLKGIINGEAYLADPARGNIRLPYQTLIEQGINEKYPEFYIMAVKRSAERPKDSTLYLSDSEVERDKQHRTEQQANAITLATVSKEHQLIVNYGFFTALGRLNDGTRSRSFNQSLGLRYGIAANTEIGASLLYSDYRQKNQTNALSVLNGTNRFYNLYINRKIPLDDMQQNGIILGVGGSLVEQYSIWGAGLNISAYANTELAQFVAGGTVQKQFSKNNFIDNSLADYQTSGFVSANKPFGDSYLASLSFSVSDAFRKNTLTEKFKPNYTVSAGLTYLLSPAFQVTPSFNYTFGDGELYSFGVTMAYVGGW